MMARMSEAPAEMVLAMKPIARLTRLVPHQARGEMCVSRRRTSEK